VPFISFSCFIALVRIASTVFNKSDEYKCACLVPDLMEKDLVVHN
jgi:hypothetical protein